MKKLNKLLNGIRQTVIGFNDKLENYFCSQQNLLADTRAEAYVGEAVKILIAVVVGALLLSLTYTLMKDTVFATVTQKVTEMFSFSGS